MNWDSVQEVKVLLGCVLAALYLVSLGLSRPRFSERVRLWSGRAIVAALLIFVTASAANYYRFSYKSFVERVDAWDTAHYFLNTKYYDELGYEHLYRCVIAADRDNGGRFHQFKRVRRMSDYRRKPAKTFLATRHFCDEAFTPQRWQAFRDDVRSMRPLASNRTWGNILGDHGYNGPPFLALYGEVTFGSFSASALPWLTKVGLGWVIAAFVAVGWAYGPRNALFLAAFVFTMWPSRWPELGHTVARYDWLGALLIAMAFLRKDKHGAGGVFIAVATLLRVFPGAFVIVYLVKAGIEIVQAKGGWRERVPRTLVHFVVAYGLTLVIGVGATFANGGMGPYQTWIPKIAQHAAPNHLNFTRMGLPMALAFRGEKYDPRRVMGSKFRSPWSGKLDPDRKKPYRAWWKDKLKVVNKQAPWLPVFALVSLALIGVGARRLSWDKAMALGFVPLFCLTVAHPFFYVMLAVPFLALVSSDRVRDGPAVLILLATGPIAFFLEVDGYFRYLLCGLFSAMLVVFCVAEIIVVAAPVIRERWLARGDA